MSAATKLLLPLMAAAALGACRKADAPADDNIVITNEIPANADVEALPADESSGTTTNELVTGDDNPDVNAAANQTKSD